MIKFPLPPRRQTKSARRFIETAKPELNIDQARDELDRILPLRELPLNRVQAGTPVQVRLANDLLTWLDIARGPLNRQQFIRNMLTAAKGKKPRNDY